MGNGPTVTRRPAKPSPSGAVGAAGGHSVGQPRVGHSTNCPDSPQPRGTVGDNWLPGANCPHRPPIEPVFTMGLLRARPRRPEGQRQTRGAQRSSQIRREQIRWERGLVPWASQGGTPDTGKRGLPRAGNDGASRPEGGGQDVRASLPTWPTADTPWSPTDHCMDFLNHSAAGTTGPSENVTSPVMEFWE